MHFRMLSDGFDWKRTQKQISNIEKAQADATQNASSATGTNARTALRRLTSDDSCSPICSDCNSSPPKNGPANHGAPATVIAMLSSIIQTLMYMMSGLNSTSGGTTTTNTNTDSTDSANTNTPNTDDNDGQATQTCNQADPTPPQDATHCGTTPPPPPPPPPTPYPPPPPTADQVKGSAGLFGDPHTGRNSPPTSTACRRLSRISHRVSSRVKPSRCLMTRMQVA